MLEIKEVKKSYGEFQLDCSLNVEKGRITGLVGENGAGKSTVFKAVLGLISYDGGEIKILGKTPQELSEKEKEQMGVVLAEAGFSGYLKGKDVKAVLAKLYPKFEEEKFLQMCERYQIPLILVSMGKEGSRAYYGEKMAEAAPFLQKNTVETTGAGDTFCGCVLHYICEYGLEHLTKDNLKEMLTFANAAASIVTTRKGALKVMPDREEVERMML